MKVKICGLSREEDIDYVNEIKPDFIGFVFAKSRRQVTLEKAQLLKNKLNEDIPSVGVFVNEDIDFIVELVNLHIIDYVQLHGQEDDNYIQSLKNKINVPLIKAMNIANYRQCDVDYYLMDSPVAGSGKTFDWKLLPKMDKPYFLAGGINLNNLDEALKQDCFGIDLSSGVETNGVKDKDKIKEVVRRVHNECR